MAPDFPDVALQLRSLVTSEGKLELSLHEVAVPAPAANMTTATVAGTPERPVVTASVKEGTLGALSARLDKSLPVGNEGAGTVVAAGSSPAAQALVGRKVAIAGGAMYSQYRAVDAS